MIPTINLSKSSEKNLKVSAPIIIPIVEPEIINFKVSKSKFFLNLVK